MARVILHGDPEWSGPPPEGCKWYLCHFAHKYLHFRRAEVESLAAMAGCPLHSPVWRAPPSTNPDMHPFWTIALPSDDVAKQITARSMLCKAIIELWGEGDTWEQLQESVTSYPQSTQTHWLAENKTFKVLVSMHGCSLSIATQRDYMERLTYVDFQGKVDLKRPEVVFRLQLVDDSISKGLGEPGTLPHRIYFGRQVSVFDHSPVQRYHLPNRPYIGPTSMDPEMALIMCNMAQVQKGQFVCDPYMGTGSIGVAAAHYDAYVLGLDIDPRVVKLGKTDSNGQPLDVFTNFRHYNMAGRLVDLLVSDMYNPCWRKEGLEGIFHSIVGDPPYGVRAGGRKIVPRDGVSVRDPSTHIVGMSAYSLGECLRDLLEFAARYLVIGGRLVYFLPATPDTYDDNEVPTHPALTLVCNSEQYLHRRYSRRLITMQKTSAYDAEAAAALYAAKPDPTMRIDRIHELVYAVPDGDKKTEGTAKLKFRSKYI